MRSKFKVIGRIKHRYTKMAMKDHSRPRLSAYSVVKIRKLSGPRVSACW